MVDATLSLYRASGMLHRRSPLRAAAVGPFPAEIAEIFNLNVRGTLFAVAETTAVVQPWWVHHHERLDLDHQGLPGVCLIPGHLEFSAHIRISPLQPAPMGISR